MAPLCSGTRCVICSATNGAQSFKKCTTQSSHQTEIKGFEYPNFLPLVIIAHAQFYMAVIFFLPSKNHQLNTSKWLILTFFFFFFKFPKTLQPDIYLDREQKSHFLCPYKVCVWMARAGDITPSPRRAHVSPWPVLTLQEGSRRWQVVGMATGVRCACTCAQFQKCADDHPAVCEKKNKKTKNVCEKTGNWVK